MIETDLFALPRQLIKQTEDKTVILEVQLSFDKTDVLLNFIVRNKWIGKITDYIEMYFQTYPEALEHYDKCLKRSQNAGN